MMSNLGTCRFWTHAEESSLIHQSHTDTRCICVSGDKLGEPSSAIRSSVQKATLRTRDQLQRRGKDNLLWETEEPKKITQMSADCNSCIHFSMSSSRSLSTPAIALVWCTSQNFGLQCGRITV